MSHPRVLVLPESALGQFDVLTVGCLARGGRQVIVTAAGAVLELSRMQRRLGAWFIDESVEGSGQLFVATPLDPVLAVLPLLARNASTFRPLGDIWSEGGPAYGRLAQLVPNLPVCCAVVCETKEVPGFEPFVRFSRERMFRWLLCKVEASQRAVAAGLAGRTATVGGAAVSRNLNLGDGSGSSAAPIDPKAVAREQLHAAVDLVRDWAGEEWGQALYRHYGLAEADLENARFKSAFAPVDVGPTMSVAGPAAEKAKPESQTTAGQKRLRKVDTTGMAKLTDMFAKKPKPEQK
jgi:hypothetical protein